MKELIGRHALSSIVFGLIMTIVAYMRGEVIILPIDGESLNLPVWLQMVILFIAYGGVFLVVNMIMDFIARKIRGRR